MNTMLIVGATGLIGESTLARFAAADDWDAIAVSRRIPEPVEHGSFRHLSVDLTDREACRRGFSALGEVTHVVYTAVAEQPGLMPGWYDRAQMQLNLDMLRNVLEPLGSTAKLQHVTLLQGAKAYGAHAGFTPRVPERERAPRLQHDNFYWLQEDYVREKAIEAGFRWTVFRPQVVIGAATGAVMNPLLPLAAYAALRREEGKPFSYPGGALQIGELADPELLAEAFEWAAVSDRASNETFNITNGDVFSWREAWPVIAEALQVEVGEDEPMRLAEYLPEQAAKWDALVARHGLRSRGLLEFLGQSHHYIDLLLRPGELRPQVPTLLSTIKLRQAGFASCRDSEDSIRHWVAVMQRRGLIPIF